MSEATKAISQASYVPKISHRLLQSTRSLGQEERTYAMDIVARAKGSPTMCPNSVQSFVLPSYLDQHTKTKATHCSAADSYPIATGASHIAVHFAERR